RRCRSKRVLRREIFPVLPSAAQQPVKTRGGDQILTNALVAEAENANQVSDQACGMSRYVRIARIAAPNMRAKGARSPGRITVIGELVERELLFSLFLVLAGSAARDRSGTQGNKGCPIGKPTPYKCFREFVSEFTITGRSGIEKLPEASDILSELSHHEISSVQAKILLPRMIFRFEQLLTPGILWAYQRTVSESSVLIRVAQQEFTEGNDVSICKLIAIAGHLARLLPVERGLADAINEAEWFDAVQI